MVFIFDECHRSQFGENHKAIKEFFPNAQLFGFTGTPIFDENSTQKMGVPDRKSTRLNSSHMASSYAVSCLKKKKESQLTRPNYTSKQDNLNGINPIERIVNR